MDSEIGAVTPAFGQPPANRNIFEGQTGLRAGWRLAIYIVIVLVATVVLGLIVQALHLDMRGLSAWGLLRQEVPVFAIAFGAALIMSRIERRPVGVYGLPGREMFAGKFWLGFLFGLLEVSLLIGLIGLFGGSSLETWRCSRLIFLGWVCCIWWDSLSSDYLRSSCFEAIRNTRWGMG